MSRGNPSQTDQACPYRMGCASPTSTPEELERRAIIQRNDLLLHEAVIKNDTEGVRKILKEPVDINCRNNVSTLVIDYYFCCVLENLRNYDRNNHH